jgi:NAD-dependent dihydropyrimidine dehydrogenase PreA subunit
MARIDTHPSVLKLRANSSLDVPATSIAADELKALALAAGADDAGAVDIDDPLIDDQRDIIKEAFPFAQTLLSFVRRMNPESVRSPMRSMANLEFHETGDDVTETGRQIVRKLAEQGIPAANANMAFPMEASRWPDRMWVVSHKPVAVAAGLGRMGIHRSVIHPRFGSFILLGTVVIGARTDAHTAPLEFNPCLECKLCVAACPTGAIAPDGAFNFQACFTHNYREFMGGFTDWIEGIADSPSALAYRQKFRDDETVSMWQSLAFGANYKAAYCLAVCPAGEDVIGPYLADAKEHRDRLLKPLVDKVEDIYVIAGSDAEDVVQRRFPNKRLRRVGSAMRVRTIKQFLSGLPLIFQRNRSAGLDAVYHFTFTGSERTLATVEIRNKTLTVRDGHVGAANLKVVADAATWIAFLAKERSMPWALITRRIKLRGSPRLLIAFGRCFPS